MRKVFFLVTILMAAEANAQNKKPLDHTVYDSWQSIGERKISNDGKWILYTVDVQEGDGNLVIQSADLKYREMIARGYNITITDDSRYAVFKIKPPYAGIRLARIQKKTPDQFPKDSLCIVELGRGVLLKVARVKTYKVPEQNAQWIAWQMEKPIADTAKKEVASDSLKRVVDSLKRSVVAPAAEQAQKRQRITNPPVNKSDDETFSLINNPALSYKDAGDEPASTEKKEEGTELVVFNFRHSVPQTLDFVSEYIWSKTGNILVTETTASKKDSMRKPAVCIFRTIENRLDTIMKGGNDFRNYAIDEQGYQLAFVAERDSSDKALQRFYKLWYWQNGYDSAVVIADKNIAGMPVGWSISENAGVHFSKSGNRLFAGSAPVQPPKDTSLIDIDLVKVDIWSYKDDYLQPIQLKNLDKDIKKGYTAMIDLESKKFVQLADRDVEDIVYGNEGDCEFFAGLADTGKRAALQWVGTTLKDIYIIQPNGTRDLIKKDLSGYVTVSPAGKYVLWYDAKAHQYFTWRNGKTKNISSGVRTKLYDEDFDMPTDPSSYGVMGWTQSDLSVLVYDKFDIWQLDPDGVVAPLNITGGEGRKNKVTYRYVRTDPEKKFITPSQEILLHMFSDVNKYAGLATYKVLSTAKPVTVVNGPFAINNNGIVKAKDSSIYIYTKESYVHPPDLYVNTGWRQEARLSAINPQQANYFWGTAELFKWKAYNGKQATGIVYKPENFDPKKKYPAICYFYEKLSDGLYQYIPPAPTPSRLNISFFVSRGYLVFVPDISYTTGHPGKSAYNYIVSGARALVKKGWVDSTRIGIQGQSWGGYQTAYVITQTKLFKAAWAGAPVGNMTSAYGGIRWSTGMNRQFQYEKTQSRIGATLWQKPQLYIENSPLFYLPKVTTPLVIMHNDNDGAVPWYQGIELFTGLRRLNKPVWLINYNGEAHNVMERKNRKDLQIREQQFFDWQLKGHRPAQWLSEGVPAVMKGKIWGLED